jgi:transposase
MVRKIQKRHLLDVPLTREEVETLEQLSKHHRYADFRRRALGLLALNEGRSVVDIADMFRLSDQPIYNWARDWREKGLVGILDGHKGGAPVKLTAEMLDLAAEIARQEPLTLARIAARVAEQFPEAPTFRALSRFEWNTPPWSGVGHSRTAVAGSRAGRRVFACLAKRTLDALRAKYA